MIGVIVDEFIRFCVFSSTYIVCCILIICTVYVSEQPLLMRKLRTLVKMTTVILVITLAAKMFILKNYDHIVVYASLLFGNIAIQYVLRPRK